MNSYQLEHFPLDEFAYTPYLMIAGVGHQIEPIKHNDFAHYSDEHFSISCNKNLLSRLNGENGEIEYIIFFKGYITSLGLDQNSPVEKIVSKLDELKKSDHSGIYSLIAYHKPSNTTNVYNDSYGFSPLYYRTDTQHLISNIAGALAFESDTLDLGALRSFVSTGYIPNDHTLANQVMRFPEGVNTCLRKHAAAAYTANTTPITTAPALDIDDKSIQDSVDTFRESMQSNFQLNSNDKPIILPLSSGWDSRRILESMLYFDKQPSCYSCEGQNAAGIDVDAVHAKEIAEHYDLQHQITYRHFISRNYEHSKYLRILMSAESSEHTWSYSLFKETPNDSYIFDGLAGDVLGNSGFGDVSIYGKGKDTQSFLVNYLVDSRFNFLFKKSIWPNRQAITAAFEQHMSHYPNNDLAPELLFLSLHTRRRTSLWGQSLTSPKNVVIAPFMERKYLTHMLSVKPLQKFTQWMQQKALAKSNMELSQFKGSRDYAGASHNKAFDDQCRNENTTYLKALIKELLKQKGLSAFSILTLPQALFLSAYCYLPIKSNSVVWRYRQIVEVLHWWHIDRPRLNTRK